MSGSLDKTVKLWELFGEDQRSVCKATFSGHQVIFDLYFNLIQKNKIF